MAAIATLGRVDEFDGTRDDWLQYVERLEFFFSANGVDDADKKRSVLLTVIGAATYKTLRNILSPEKPGEKPYAELVESLSKYFKPTPSEIVERFKFHSRVRKAGESISTYVAELRSLTEYCNFGPTLDNMIRDRLVCGVNDGAIQKRLLAEPALTYGKAVELALSAEMAAQSMRELGGRTESGTSGRSTSQGVHKMTPPHTSRSAYVPSAQGSGQPVPTCYRCGRKGHTVPKCRIDKDVVCHRCKKKGHLQRACRSQGRTGQDKPRRTTSTVSRLQEEVDGIEEEELDEAAANLYQIRGGRRISPPPITVRVKLDDRTVDMEVDCGASLSLMAESTFNRLWPGRSLLPSSVRLQTYLQEPIQVVGCCNEYNGQSRELPLEVVAGGGPTLLGRDWMSQIRLDWGQIHQVHNASLLSILDKYKGVFKEELGTLKGFKAKIYVDPDAPPRYHSARSVPFAMRGLVEKELQHLQEEGTLEPVEMAEWAAPIVVVFKKDRSSVRICGDFRVTVNPVSKLDRYPIPKVEDLFVKLSKGKHFSKLDLRQAYQQIELEEDSKRYVVINTQRGLFRYTRLPFGIASAVSSSCVIEELRTLFARFGLPEMIVSDNGTCFVSREFEEFLRKNGVKHTTSAPYHPSSNGLAERAVQVIKRGLKKDKEGSMSARLARVLFNYRITPQSTTGLAPTELLLGRRPRTRLDLLKPHTAVRVEGKQQEQKGRHDTRSKVRSFEVGDAIFLKNFGAGARWLPGKIVEKSGLVSYHVVLEDGRRKRCHQDQLRSRIVSDGPPEMSEIAVDADVPVSTPNISATGTTESSDAPGHSFELPEIPARDSEAITLPASDPIANQPQTSGIRTPSLDTLEPRYPVRLRKPRRWFEPGKT